MESEHPPEACGRQQQPTSFTRQSRAGIAGHGRLVHRMAFFRLQHSRQHDALVVRPLRRPGARACASKKWRPAAALCTGQPSPSLAALSIGGGRFDGEGDWRGSVGHGRVTRSTRRVVWRFPARRAMGRPAGTTASAPWSQLEGCRRTWCGSARPAPCAGPGQSWLGSPHSRPLRLLAGSDRGRPLSCET